MPSQLKKMSIENKVFLYVFKYFTMICNTYVARIYFFTTIIFREYLISLIIFISIKYMV